MAAYGSLQHIFDNPLPESPTLLESLSTWNQIKSVKNPVDPQPSLTEIFGELYFKEDPLTPSYSYGDCHKRSEGLSVMNSESLQLCTEGLGVESSDDIVEDLREERRSPEERLNVKCSKNMETGRSLLCGEFRRSRTSGGGTFPPPISCIGESGKPWFWFKPHRKDGRLVLREVRIPTREFLHSWREDGRLKMHFVHPNDEILEEEDEEGMEDMEEFDGDEEGNTQLI
ncbi:hypothetical protein SLE2022_004170 [Rubroshorea leprosula]